MDPEASLLFLMGGLMASSSATESALGVQQMYLRLASDKESAVRSFHKNIRHIALQGEQTGKVGKFGLGKC